MGDENRAGLPGQSGNGCRIGAEGKITDPRKYL